MKQIVLTLLLVFSVSTIFAQTKTKAKKTVKSKVETVKATPVKSTASDAKPAEVKQAEVKPAVVVPSTSVVDPNQPKPSNAKIEFVETTYNFGDVPEAGQIEHNFKFKNTGTEPLILSDVRASCGCTTPSWPKEPIMPNESKDIKVQYNTQGRPGNFNKTITITSNASEPTTRITIQGNVIKAETGGTPEKVKSVMEEK